MKSRARSCLLLVILFSCLLVVAGKAVAVAWRTGAVVTALEALQTLPDASALKTQLGGLETALANLDAELRLFYPILQRLPGDLGAVPDLLPVSLTVMPAARDVADLGVAAQRYQANPTAQMWLELVKAAHNVPWAEVRARLLNTRPARERLKARANLSERTAKIIRAFDNSADLGEAIAEAAPYLLDNLSHDYRVVVIGQNSDELRATGGFFTALIVFTIHPDGKSEVEFLNSYAVEGDRNLIDYPAPPAPMRLEMANPKWVFRDANWSPDFPTTARQAAYFFNLARQQTPDAIVAVNLNAIRAVVDAVGPIHLGSTATPVNSDEVVAQMRRAWNITPETITKADAKDFLIPFLEGIGANIQTTQNQVALISTIKPLLATRDIMLYTRDAQIQRMIASRSWDGAQRKPQGDYLMVVDTNIGYNKVNPNIRQKIEYHVSLADPQQPFAQASLTYQNVNANVPCTQHVSEGTATYEQRMTACYWDFLRLYIPYRSQLLAHNLEGIPAEWSYAKRAFPGLVSAYPVGSDYTVLEGYTIVPTGETKTWQIAYRLPASILQAEANTTTYRLLIQKQAGAPAFPLQVNVDLPAGATLVSSTPPIANRSEQTVSFVVDKTEQDVALTLNYQQPPQR